jgi:hypothetical protein
MDRCVNWPKELIRELCNDTNVCDLPSMSQEVNMYTQDSNVDRLNWEAHILKDTDAVQNHKECQGKFFIVGMSLVTRDISVGEEPFLAYRGGVV